MQWSAVGVFRNAHISPYTFYHFPRWELQSINYSSSIIAASIWNCYRWTYYIMQILRCFSRSDSENPQSPKSSVADPPPSRNKSQVTTGYTFCIGGRGAFTWSTRRCPVPRSSFLSGSAFPLQAPALSGLIKFAWISPGYSRQKFRL